MAKNKQIFRFMVEQYRRHKGNSLIYWEEFPLDAEEFDALEYVQGLVRLGARPRAILGERKIAPLHRCNDPKIVAALIAVGANVKAKDFRMYTPLHLCENVEVAKLLIDAGADVNARNDNDITPLHFAESVEVARLLIESGANPNVIDRWGRTCADVQRESGDNDVACYLSHFIDASVIRETRRQRIANTGLSGRIERFYQRYPDMRGVLDGRIEQFYRRNPDLRGVLDGGMRNNRIMTDDGTWISQEHDSPRPSFHNNQSPSLSNARSMHSNQAIASNVSSTTNNNHQHAVNQESEVVAKKAETTNQKSVDPDIGYRFDLDWDD